MSRETLAVASKTLREIEKYQEVFLPRYSLKSFFLVTQNNFENCF